MVFKKVSFEQYEKSVGNNINLRKEYDDIKLPKRATKYSAGYDFFSPFDFSLSARETIKIPTGIRVILDNDKYLAIVPRSGLGFKYRLQLDNTIGIVDADYSKSDNEGHIFIKITNDSNNNKILHINKGEAFAQGIVSKYYLMEDDYVTEERNGGFGSTN